MFRTKYFITLCLAVVLSCADSQKTENQTIIKYQKEEEGEERIQRRKDLKKAFRKSNY